MFKLIRPSFRMLPIQQIPQTFALVKMLWTNGTTLVAIEQLKPWIHLSSFDIYQPYEIYETPQHKKKENYYKTKSYSIFVQDGFYEYAYFADLQYTFTFHNHANILYFTSLKKFIFTLLKEKNLLYSHFLFNSNFYTFSPTFIL